MLYLLSMPLNGVEVRPKDGLRKCADLYLHHRSWRVLMIGG